MAYKDTAILYPYRVKVISEENKGKNSIYTVYLIYCFYPIYTRIAPGICILSKIGIGPVTWRITALFQLGYKINLLY